MKSGTLLLVAIVVVLAVGSLLLVRQSRRLRSSGAVPHESGEMPTGGPDHS